MKNLIAACLCLSAAGTAIGAPRDVQIVSVDLDNGIVELENLGSASESLAGWRFCSHNSSAVRRYTSAGGFGAASIAPGGSVSVYLNNDSPGGAGDFNVSALGGAFASLERDAFGLEIYFPNDSGFVVFGDGNLIADHLQWSLGGSDNIVADERSDEAVAGGVWTAEDDWISVSASSQSITLDDLSGAVLHGPSDYTVTEPCAADLAAPFGVLNFFDLGEFLTRFNAQDASVDFAAPFGVFNFFDLGEFLTLFNQGCP